MGPIITITMAELKAHLLKYREKVAEEGAIVYVTYWGRPKMALVPVEDAKRIEHERTADVRRRPPPQ